MKTLIKSLIYILIITTTLYSCEPNNVESKPLVKEDKTPYLVWGKNIEIWIIDSCEYIMIPNGSATWGSHKGNCKNCLNRTK